MVNYHSIFITLAPGGTPSPDLARQKIPIN
jgi:hypothetical protein